MHLHLDPNSIELKVLLMAAKLLLALALTLYMKLALLALRVGLDLYLVKPLLLFSNAGGESTDYVAIDRAFAANIFSRNLLSIFTCHASRKAFSVSSQLVISLSRAGFSAML